MHRRKALWLLSALPLTAWAQAPEFSVEEMFEEGRKFLEENVDEDVLRVLGEGDEAKVRTILDTLLRKLDQEYVLDLGAYKDSARFAARLLDLHPETQPYAGWLRTRLDYFDVSEELRRAAPPPPPPPAPGKPPPPPPNPTPQQQRAAWQRVVEARPQPKGAAHYVPKLKPVFTRYGLPPSMVWLAEVESSFNPEARSPVGAVGLYQLMPKTAQLLGLALKPRDERLLPEKNASAAARHLKRLYAEFQDWPLTIAAYNAGQGRIRSAMQKTKGRTFDAIAARLPAETQLYVPKLEATLRRREKTSLSRLPAPKRV